MSYLRPISYNSQVEPYTVNQQDPNSEKNALHLAIENKQLERVENLIKSGTSIVMTDKAENTPLHTACANNFAECIEMLKQAGADINAKNKDGFTPLMIAIENKNYELADALLSFAQIDLNVQDNSGRTALLLALELIDAIRHEKDLAPRAHKEAVSKVHEKEGLSKVIEKLLIAKTNVEIFDSRGLNALHIACMIGDLELVRLLKNHQANVNILERTLQIPPVSLILKHSNFFLMDEILEFPNINIDQRDKFGMSALDNAIIKLSSSSVKKLLEKGANPNDADPCKNTALHNVCRLNPLNCDEQLEIIKLLIGYGASLEAKNDKGHTPLDLCCSPLIHVYLTDRASSARDYRLNLILKENS